jgi:hypothetical protein
MTVGESFVSPVSGQLHQAAEFRLDETVNAPPRP